MNMIPEAMWEFIAIIVAALAIFVSIAVAGRQIQISRKEQTFDYIFRMSSELITELYYLSSREPVNPPTKPDHIEINELLERLWKAKLEFSRISAYVNNQYRDRRLIKTTKRLSEIADQGYMLISNRDATGQNMLKALAERLDILCSQISTTYNRHSSNNKKSIRARLFILREKYSDGFIDADTLDEIVKP